MDGTFDPVYSSNNIWIDTNLDACLTNNLESIDADISALQAGKVDKVNGKDLSSNDYTDTDKTKLAGIATGANKYTLPTAGTSLGGVKTTSTVSSSSGYTACPIIKGVLYYKDTNTTYTSLKNPNKLTLQFNGSTNKTYDGSSAQTFNVTPSAIGVSDYVVATGSSGTWNYRKWSSGIAEQWGPIAKHGLSNWIDWGGWVYAYDTVTFDTGIFIEAPRVFITSVGRTWCIPLTQDVTYQQFTLCGLRPSAGESSYWFDVYAIGKWK